MSQVRYFDWHFRPVAKESPEVHAIQALTTDGRIVGQASLVNRVWAATAAGRREARTYDSDDPDAVLAITAWFQFLLDTETKESAAQ